MKSRFAGKCKGCGKSYGEGAEIHWTKEDGGWHPECHQLKQSALNAADIAVANELGFIGPGEPIPAWWISGTRPVRDLSDAHRGGSARGLESAPHPQPETTLF